MIKNNLVVKGIKIIGAIGVLVTCLVGCGKNEEVITVEPVKILNSESSNSGNISVEGGNIGFSIINANDIEVENANTAFDENSEKE